MRIGEKSFVGSVGWDFMESVEENARVARKLGFEFRLVEMRWGIRAEASSSHQTSEICMAELERCQRESQGFSYISDVCLERLGDIGVAGGRSVIGCKSRRRVGCLMSRLLALGGIGGFQKTTID